jgi:hypothetical protein
VVHEFAPLALADVGEGRRTGDAGIAARAALDDIEAPDLEVAVIATAATSSPCTCSPGT